LPSEPRTRPNPTWLVFRNLFSLGSGSQPAILAACRKTTEDSIKAKKKKTEQSLFLGRLIIQVAIEFLDQFPICNCSG
jgi:hypothetical protein